MEDLSILAFGPAEALRDMCDDCEHVHGRRRFAYQIDEDLISTRLPTPSLDEAEDILSEISSDHDVNRDFITPRPSFRISLDTERTSFNSTSGARPTGRRSSRFTDQQLEPVNFKRLTFKRSGDCDRVTQERTSFELDQVMLPENEFDTPVVAGAASLLKFLQANDCRGNARHLGDSEHLGILTEIPTSALSRDCGGQNVAPHRLPIHRLKRSLQPNPLKVLPSTAAKVHQSFDDSDNCSTSTDDSANDSKECFGLTPTTTFTEASWSEVSDQASCGGVEELLEEPLSELQCASRTPVPPSAPKTSRPRRKATDIKRMPHED
jgi:hypothetical protein